ncbi:MAG TPA: hypothetical protein VK653_11110, partial [Xanthobacteraceae bacterium]|nr:hypothetical protein [Xanthobacteraceae bacterium]
MPSALLGGLLSALLLGYRLRRFNFSGEFILLGTSRRVSAKMRVGPVTCFSFSLALEGIRRNGWNPCLIQSIGNSTAVPFQLLLHFDRT